MKIFFAAAVALLALAAAPVSAEVFDAAKQYTSCSNWSYDGYRAADNRYLPMVPGHAPIREMSKYGIDAYYSPDGDQKCYPFITRLGDSLFASPATVGGRYDAALSWTAPYADTVKVTGFIKLMGDLKGHSQGKKIKAELLLNDKTLWEGAVASEQVEMKADATVAKGDKIRLRLINSGDASGDVTSFNMKIETTKNKE